MMALTFGLAGTGYMMTQDINSHFFKEIHELCANAFIVVVIAHIAGILFHTLRHKENIGLSMIDGKKAVSAEEKGIPNTHLLSGIVFVCLVGVFALHLYKNYDNSTQTLTMFGRDLHLGDTQQAD